MEKLIEQQHRSRAEFLVKRTTVKEFKSLLRELGAKENGKRDELITRYFDILYPKDTPDTTDTTEVN